MNPEEAIKILEYTFTDKWIAPKGDFGIAVKLGIEALKRVEVRRDQLSWKLEPLLPGETN